MKQPLSHDMLIYPVIGDSVYREIAEIRQLLVGCSGSPGLVERVAKVETLTNELTVLVRRLVERQDEEDRATRQWWTLMLSTATGRIVGAIGCMLLGGFLARIIDYIQLENLAALLK